MVLNGSTTPIHKCFEHFLEFNDLKNCTKEQIQQMEFVFYCSAMHTYNILVECMRRDPSMTLMVSVTAAMRSDLNDYFEDKPSPTIN